MQRKKVFKLIVANMMLICMLSGSFSSAAETESKDDLNQRLYEEIRLVYNILSTTPMAYEYTSYKNLEKYLLADFFGSYMAYRNGEMDDIAAFTKMLDTLTETRKAVKQVVPDIESLKTYIWPEGKMPAVTKYTSNPTTEYFDAPGFEPYLVPYLLDSNVEPKGAVIICPGGGFMMRSESFEGDDFAKYYNSQGYQAFVLNYRIEPYTVTESSLDLQRAIRYVRYNADKYDIPMDKIITAGSSAGGVIAITQANEMYGYVQPSRFIEGYVSDEIDKVSADANAFLGIYTGIIPDWQLTV